MSTEDEIRRALRVEAGRFDPPDDGWRGIALGVARVRRRRRITGAALSGVAVVALVVGVTLGAADTGTTVDASRDAEVAERPEPGLEPTTPATTPGAVGPATPGGTAVEDGDTAASEPVAGAPFPGIWPFPNEASIAAYADGDTTLEDPVGTTAAFARDYLGMVAPHLGDLRDAGGEEGDVLVDVRPQGEDGLPAPDGGPRTTVRLRPYPTSDGDRVWTVVDASSANIVVDEPVTSVVAGSPLAVRGSATGYEGTVVAEVRQDGMRAGTALGRTVGIAGSLGELGPLALDVDFDAPVEPAGALVVTTDSGLGGPAEATVVRIGFAATGAPPPPDPGVAAGGGGCAPAGPAGEPGPDEMDVRVFLVCAPSAEVDPKDPATYVGVTRRVPLSSGVLRASLVELLRGATEAEAATGLEGVTDPAVDVLRDVVLEGEVAIVDFAPGLVQAATGASTSTGRALLRGALDRTVLQFPTVEAVEYRLGGVCEDFWDWHRFQGCPRVDRPGDTT